MKMIKTLAALLLCAAILAACGGGDVSAVARRIGRCERFSESQIADAMDKVESFFRDGYDDCKLLRLEYDEEKTLEEARGWTDQYGAEAIVLVSDFYVWPGGGDGSLQENETYENWKWILVKTAIGWELKTWGYG
jgi:predicted small secreted protein